MRLFKLIFSLVLILLLSFQNISALSIYEDYSADSNQGIDNDNLPPVADFSFTKKQKMDIVFVLGSSAYSMAVLKNKVSSIITPALSGNDREPDFYFVSSTSGLDVTLSGRVWGDSSERYYIAVNNGAYPELSDVNKLSSVITELNNDNVCFIGIGNSSNRAAIDKLVSNNSGRGLFIDGTSLDTALTTLRDYLAGDLSVDLYFNVGLGTTPDIIKTKYESIMKPKLVANDIKVNVVINNGAYDTLEGSKVVACTDIWTTAAGHTKPLLLKVNGTLWNMSTGAKVIGEKGVGNLTDIVDAAAGFYDYIAADSSGNVYQWTETTYPTKVAGLNNIVKVASSEYGKYALRNDGTVWYWGTFNSWNYLSQQNVYLHGWDPQHIVSQIIINTPKQVKFSDGSPLTGIVQIVAAADGGNALDSSGKVYILSGSTYNQNETFGDKGGFQTHSFANAELMIGAGGVTDLMKPHSNPWISGTDKMVIKKLSSASVCEPDAEVGRSLSNIAIIDNVGRPWFVNGRIDFGYYEDGYWNTDHYYFPGAHDSFDYPFSYYYYPDGGWFDGYRTRKKVKDVFPTYNGICVLEEDGNLYKVYSYNNDTAFSDSGHIYERYTGSAFWDANPKATNVYSMASWGSTNYYIKNDGAVYNDGGLTGWDVEKVGQYLYDSMLSKASFKNSFNQYFIEVSSNALPELSNQGSINKIKEILNDNNIRTIGIGSAANSAGLKLVNTINGDKGAYYNISNLDAAMNSLADYIVANTEKPPRLISDYMLISEDVDAPTVFYSDIEHDAYHSKWIYEHNPNNFYSSTGSSVPFDNSAGYFSLDRKILSSPVASFIDTDSSGAQVGKVGGYKVSLQMQDKPKGDNTAFSNYKRDSNMVTKFLNLHRKPVAYYTVSITDDGTNYNIVLNDNNLSYDPDHTSRVDKGIAKRIWGIAKITKAGNVSWTYAKVNDSSKTYKVPKGFNYLVSLSVQDIDGPFGLGAWSDPVIVGVPGRPVAEFDISPNPLPVSQTAAVTDMSYVTAPGCSIAKRRWNIKKVGSLTFSYVNKPTCKTEYSDSGVGNYVITLEVQDSNGVWSLPCEKTLTVIDTVPPTLTAVPASRKWSNTNAAVTLSCHDDGGSGLKRLDYVWTLKPSDISDYSSAGISGVDDDYITTQSANGKWYLCARALDNSDNYSNNGNFNIFGTYNVDKLAPTVSASIAPGTYQTSVSATINASDTGGSGIKSVRYKWTNTTATPSSGWTETNTAAPEDNSESVSANLDIDGTWFLHTQVTDHAGNTSYKYVGPVTIQFLGINDVTIEGYWNHWRGQVDLLGKQLTNEPHRFLSLECVKINISTSGNPDRIAVRFSPELEAMNYTDPGGHTSSYSEYFGHEVSFPEDSTFLMSGNHAYWEYNLPLAPSSKDWNDVRLRPRYSMTVTAYKGNRSVTRTINDIDITGNIYDLTYIQPQD
ncbi:MAG TPA: hypothetical protein VHT96_02355 [Clostridia bacterium]|nr:hypothetical protein [Clostridia bacterium]